MRWNPWFCVLLLASPAVWSQQSSTSPRVEPGTGLVYSVPAGKAGPASNEPVPCPATFTDGIEILKKEGDGIVAPKTTKTQPAKFPKESRDAMKKDHKTTFEAVSLVSLVVSADGLPEKLCIKRPAGYGLDVEALKAVTRYRFEPASKEGTPFPARIFIEVNFKSE
ncbi:MAG TPA: energy transducer TonB [Terracidiphilus sp.]|jgi:TonB family protein|nr:energy transducer TonB [Terracidiphilus sp.]